MPSNAMVAFDRIVYKRRWPVFWAWIPPHVMAQEGDTDPIHTRMGFYAIIDGETEEIVYPANGCIDGVHRCQEKPPRGEPVYVVNPRQRDMFYWSAQWGSVLNGWIVAWWVVCFMVFMVLMDWWVFDSVQDQVDDPVIVIVPAILLISMLAVNMWFPWYTRINPPRAAMWALLFMAMGAAAEHSKAKRRAADQHDQDQRRLAQYIAQAQAQQQRGRSGPLSYGG